MQVRDVMRRDPRVTSPGATLAQAGKMMHDACCGALPVIGDGEQVVGMITDRDICLALANRDRKPSDVTVRQAISGEVYTCGPDDDVRDSLRTMRDRLVRRLPVVDERGHLAGILTLDDVMVAARPHPTEGFDGPFYADVANTLQRIAQREQLQVPV